MTQQETYLRAPSIEAVLDIRVRLPPDVPIESLEQVQAEEIKNYPVVRRPFQVAFKVTRPDGVVEPTTETSHAMNGYMFVSEDGLQIFQSRPDGFSHNRLAPYLGWEPFHTEARRLWNVYKTVARPEAIEMLGLNYVNKIDLPAGEISDYLKTYIQIPPELPQSLEAHNLLAQMADEKSGAKIVISEAFGAVGNDDTYTMMLNIQTFRHINKPVSSFSEDEIWDTFATLRTLKNLAFESTITDKVRERFR